MRPSVLVVDDDRKTVNIIRLYLEKENFDVFEAYDGSQALRMARHRQPTMVVLDLMLPQVDGLDVCCILRAESEIPIIMLTARTTEEDKLLGLELGADDYITKPFSPRELVARVRAVLRRTLREAEDDTPSEIYYRELHIDFMRHEVSLGGEPIYLTPREFRLLETLARQPGRTYSRTQLLERAFGLDYDGLERTIDVHIKNLRKKIEPDAAQPTFILTVYGIGYKFAEE